MLEESETFVELGVHEFLLGCTDTRQNERLALVVSVGTCSEVDLLRVCVSFVRLGDAENRVRRTHLE